MSLKEDLEARVKSSRRVARCNYYAVYILLFLAVAASASATISVAAGKLSPARNAALAAIPGIIVLAMSTFKFDSRAEWWWPKHHRLERLHRGLAYEGRAEAEASHDLSQIIEELEARWPTFGKPPSAADH